MRTAASVAVALALVASPASASGVASVVGSSFGCSYYVVETPRGYALLEWSGGHFPDEGEELVGDLSRKGLTELFFLDAERQGEAYVGRRFASKSHAEGAHADHCS